MESFDVDSIALNTLTLERYGKVKKHVLDILGDKAEEMMSAAVSLKDSVENRSAGSVMLRIITTGVMSAIDELTPTLFEQFVADHGIIEKLSVLDQIRLRERILKVTQLIEMIQLEGNFIRSLLAQFPAVAEFVNRLTESGNTEPTQT